MLTVLCAVLLIVILPIAGWAAFGPLGALLGVCALMPCVLIFVATLPMSFWNGDE